MTEENLYPGAKEFAPMKIWDAPKNKQEKVQECINSGDYFGSVKKDGFWYQFEKTENGDCYLFSRTISTKTGHLVEKAEWVPHITRTLKEYLPNGTILIGEIYYPKKSSKNVTEVMQCLVEKALERQQKNGLLHFYIHDIIYLNNEDLRQTPAWERQKLLKKVLEKDILWQNPTIELADMEDANLMEYIQHNFDTGEEGTILKKKDSIYQDGKRPSWATLKFKTETTVDVVLMNLIPATKEYTGKEEDTWQYWETQEGEKYCGDKKNSNDIPVTKGYYYDWITSFEIGYKNYGDNYVSIGTVASGLTDEICAMARKSPERFIGSVIEVQCMSVDKEAGTLRHPRFKRFREDKMPEECTWTDIFEK